VEHLGELAGAAGTLWAAFETFRRRRAAAREAAERQARELEARRAQELAQRLEDAGAHAQRFADVLLGRGDDATKVRALRALEAERKARGL
jgi:hypothetical protein